MTTAPRCPECGDTRRLNPSGVCAWRAGCEHRQMVSEARMAELDRLLAPAPVAPTYSGQNRFQMFCEEFEQLDYIEGGRLWFENGQWYEETWGADGPPDQG